MKLINSSWKILEQKPGIQGIYEIVELAARNCYKSEDFIKYDEHSNSLTAKDFVDKVTKIYKHGSTAEHGTVYLTIPYDKILEYVDSQNPFDRDILTNPWTSYVLDYANDLVYISTNYRHIIENNLESWLEYLCEPTEYHEKRTTVRLICDRGVMAEITRHRTASFSIESTRYCNYSKDKFNNELTFIEPSWYNDLNISVKWLFENSLKTSERIYLNLLKGNYSILLAPEKTWKFWKWFKRRKEAEFIPLTPQQARQVLPNALKTEIVMTAFNKDWEKIFDLRTAANAHPDMIALMKPLKEEFIKRGYIND